MLPTRIFVYLYSQFSFPYTQQRGLVLHPDAVIWGSSVVIDKTIYGGLPFTPNTQFKYHILSSCTNQYFPYEHHGNQNTWQHVIVVQV